MKITQVDTYFVRPRWGFVEIITDEGFVGWGEAVLEGHAAAVLACVQEMKDYLIDADPSQIEGLWETMYRAGFYRGGGVLMSAISGIDQALWDIKGKVFGVPVYELIGGRCRDKMKVYSWIGGDRPSDVGAAAKQKQAEGFKKIVDAAGGDANAAVQLMLVDKIEELIKIQVEAVKNLKIDKVTVWDSMGGKDGSSTTSNFLSGMMKSIPPLNETFKMAGIKIPEFLGKEIEETETPNTTTNEENA